MIPHMMQDPKKPAKMDWKSKALLKMFANMVPRFPAFITSTITETRMKITPMRGTRNSVTCMRRLPPPKTMNPKSTARMIPMISAV